jgi:hypothetical protein
MFFAKNTRRIKIPKSSFLKSDLKIKTAQRKVSMGSQIMVGFMAKIKMENAKRSVVFLFPAVISFKIIKERAMTGRSGLGDCENNNNTGRKHR